MEGRAFELSDLSGISAAVRKIWRWWLGELKDLVPERLRMEPQQRRRSLVLAFAPHGVDLIYERPGQPPERLFAGSLNDDTRHEIEAVVNRMVTKRRPLELGVSLSKELCHERTLDMPNAAREHLGKILELELGRTTPFDRASVYTAHGVEPVPGNRAKIRVRQLLIKRTLLDPALNELRSLGMTARFAGVWQDETLNRLPADFLENETPSTTLNTYKRRPVFWLGVLLATLVTMAVALAFRRQEAALEKLRDATTHARVDALRIQQLRTTRQGEALIFDELAQATSNRRLLIEVWRELTTRIPDTAWITDLRVNWYKGEIVGYADSAAALVEILSQSSILTQLAFTAPVTADPNARKEHFSLSFSIRQSLAVQAPEGKR